MRHTSHSACVAHPPVAASLEAVLEANFGLKQFRTGQRDAIDATLNGRDSVVILPTGAGKSLTFQFPPFTKQHAFTVVVSPLLALAKDQVDQACERGIDARVWNSEVQDAQRASVISQLCDPEVEMRLLYTTPESLRQPRLRDAIKDAYDMGTLMSFAIDEAHCVSEWGHDFRPSFLELSTLKQDFPNTPIACLTASCTARVQSSILSVLGLKNVQVIKASFNRPNIQYHVVYRDLVGDGSDESILQDVVEFIKARPGQCGIIYARLRATCDTIGKALECEDVDVAVYHAGKDARQRNRVQSEWSAGATQVVVATIAFGMGVDKPDVRWVLHYNAPTSMEGLYQESGRAGRDGLPCASVIYASKSELEGVAKMEKGTRSGAAAQVVDLLMGAHCRRKRLLAFFGEARGACNPSVGEQPCDHCMCPDEVSKALRQADKAQERKSMAAAIRARMCGGQDEEAAASGGEGSAVRRPAATWLTAKEQERGVRAQARGPLSGLDGQDAADPPEGGDPAQPESPSYGAAMLAQPSLQPLKRPFHTGAACLAGTGAAVPAVSGGMQAGLGAMPCGFGRPGLLSRPQLKRRPKASGQTLSAAQAGPSTAPAPTGCESPGGVGRLYEESCDSDAMLSHPAQASALVSPCGAGPESGRGAPQPACKVPEGADTSPAGLRCSLHSSVPKAALMRPLVPAPVFKASGLKRRAFQAPLKQAELQPQL